MSRLASRLVPTALAVAAWLCAAPASAAAPAATRVEVPIVDLVLSDRTHRYAIPIGVGATSVWASLDPGSADLRVLPGVLRAADVYRTKPPVTNRRQPGGMGSQAYLTIGALVGLVPIQLVSSAECAGDKAYCPSSQVGRRATFGIHMAASNVPSPLVALGVRRWIVELPRPGEAQPGRLVINPTDDEVAAFVRLETTAQFRNSRDPLHDSVASCVLNNDTGARVCGPASLDFGAPESGVVNGALGEQPWPEGTPTTIEFYDDQSRTCASERIAVGLQASASGLRFSTQIEFGGTILNLGLTPYFAYSVLYEPQVGAIGLKPRSDTPGPVVVASSCTSATTTGPADDSLISSWIGNTTVVEDWTGTSIYHYRADHRFRGKDPAGRAVHGTWKIAFSDGAPSWVGPRSFRPSPIGPALCLTWTIAPPTSRDACYPIEKHAVGETWVQGPYRITILEGVRESVAIDLATGLPR